MNIQIILTSYLLQFMYGDQTFQDSLLLSREVLKKAHNEGLYYISSKEMIERIIETNTLPPTMFIFAGIPSMEEIALNQTVKPVLYALKLKIPYECLAKFSFEKEETDSYLSNDDVSRENISYEPFTLHLSINEHKPFYEEKTWKENKIIPLKEKEIIKYFPVNLNQYSFSIKRKLDFLQEKWNSFLASPKCLPYIEEESNLQFIKSCYEEIVYEDIKKH